VLIVASNRSILYECLVCLYLFLGFGDSDIEGSAWSHPVKANTRFLVEVGHLTVGLTWMDRGGMVYLWIEHLDSKSFGLEMLAVLEFLK